MFKKRVSALSQNLALEPRVMFDAALAADMIDTHDAEDLDQVYHDMVADGFGADTETPSGAEIYVIDSRVEHASDILSALPKNAVVLELNTQNDGFAQIADFLATSDNVSAVHIFAHGEPGKLFLGQGESTVETMLGAQADTLSQLSQHLNKDADILIYGCDFAQGDAGVKAAATLSALTQADVAASNDATGAQALGGDWDLEIKVGDIETDALAAVAYSGLFAVDATSNILTVQDIENGTSGSVALTAAANTSTDVPRVVETMYGQVWTFAETDLGGSSTDLGKGSFVFDISSLGLSGTKASDFGIVISTDGNFTDEDSTRVYRASGFDATTGKVFFHGVNAQNGDIVGFATQTKAADNILIANDTVVIGEDNQVDLGVTFHKTLTDGGTLPAIVSTEVGYLAENTSTPLTFKIPAGTTSINLVAYSNLAGSNDVYNDDFRSMTATIDLDTETSSGFMNRITDARSTYNTVYTWEGATFGNVVTGFITNNRAGSNYGNADPSFDIIDGELRILDVNGYQTAYHVEFQSSETASATFLGTSGETLSRLDQSDVVVNIPENANYVKIIQYDAAGGNDVSVPADNRDRIEHKGMSVHYVDLETFLASGASMNGYGTGADRVATFAYNDHDVSINTNAGAVAASSVGDISASDGGVNGSTITTDGTTLTVSRDADFADKYQTMFTFEFYDRKDFGSPAEILGSSSDMSDFDASSPNNISELEFVVPEGSKLGLLNLSMSQNFSNKVSSTNENMGTGYVLFDLEKLTSTGTIFFMRNVNPDFMTWENLDLGKATEPSSTLWESYQADPNSGSVTTNKTDYAQFTDQFVANAKFNFSTNTNGDTVITMSTYSTIGSTKDKYEYYALGSMEWYGTAPVKLFGAPPGGAFDGDIGTYDPASGAYIIDLEKAGVNGIKYTPPEHYSGVDDVLLTISFGPEQDVVKVIQTPVLDEISFDTTSVTDLEGASVAIGALVQPALIDLDGSESITKTTVTGLSVGHTISDGQNSFTATSTADVTDITAWNLSNLTYFAGQDENGTFTFDVTVTHEDNLAKSLDQTVIDAMEQTVQDSLIQTDEHTQTVQVVLTSVNDVPVAIDDSFTVISGGALIISPADILGNDSDIDGDTLTISVVPVSGPSNGQIVMNNDGTFTYTHDGSSAQIDSFTYRITDSNGGFAEATVDIDVIFAPESADKTITIDEDSIYTFTLADFAFTDPDTGDQLASLSIAQPSEGALYFDGVKITTFPQGITPADLTSGRLTFAPFENENGIAYATIDFVVSDGVLTDPLANTITFNITPVNDPVTLTGTEITVPAIVDGQTGVSIQTAGAFVDPDGETLTYSALGLPDGLVIDPDTGEITSLPTGVVTSASQTGPYTVTITALSPDGTKVSKEITIGVSNPAPTAVQIPDQGGVDGETISIDAASLGNFTDEDKLSYAATGLPSGLSIDPVTGEITGTLDSSASVDGPYTVTVIATDADGKEVEVTFEYAVSNPAPLTTGVPDQAAVDGDSVTLDVATLGGFTDEDELSYEMTGLPDGFTIDPQTGVIQGTFDGHASQDGPFTVEVTATDKDGKSVTTTFNYGVSNPVPVASLIEEKDVVDGTTVRIPMTDLFTDPDGDPLAYTIDTLPASLGAGSIVTENGVSYLEIVIDNSASQSNGGTHNISLSVDDGDGGTVSTTLTLNVTNPEPEDHPDIELTAQDGDKLSYSLSDIFTDPDGDVLSYSVTSAPAGLGPVSIIMVDGVPTLDVDIDTSASQTTGGLHEVVIQVDDGEGGIAEVTFVIKVDNPAPATTGIPDQSAKEGESVSLPVAEIGGFTDEDTLTYAMTGLPEGFVIDPETGVITGTFSKTAAQEGPYTVTITATDADGKETTVTFEYGVDNVAPTTTKAPITGTNLIDGQSVSIATAHGFEDGDGDVLTFGATGLPAGLVIDPLTGKISGILDPSASVDGPYEVVITATDTNGDTVSRTVTLNAKNTEITAVELPDKIERIGAPIDDISVDIFEDADGDTLDINVAGLPDGVTFDPATKTISGAASGFVLPGDYPITVTAIDNEGSTVTVKFVMTILADPSTGGGVTSPLSNVYAGSAVDDVFTNRPSDVLELGAEKEIEKLGKKVLLDSLNDMMPTDSFRTEDTEHSTLQVVDDINTLTRHLDKVVTPDYVQVIHISVSEQLQGTDKPLSSAQVMLGDSRILYYLNANEGVDAVFSADAYLGGVSVSKAGAIVVENWVDAPFEVTMEIKENGTVSYLTIEIDPRLHNAEIIAAETRASLLSERLDWTPAMY